MILSAFEALYDRMPPAWMRKVEVAVLMDVFARAFDVDAPSLEGADAGEALVRFREFTAACMEACVEAAGADEAAAARYRDRLGAEALELGRKVRRSLGVRRSNALRVARFFYRGIAIDLDGALPGTLRFGPCFFAGRYSAGDCKFMSAFDEGFIRGLSGLENAALEFSCRLTEGEACCLARFSKPDERGTS